MVVRGKSKTNLIWDNRMWRQDEKLVYLFLKVRWKISFSYVPSDLYRLVMYGEFRELCLVGSQDYVHICIAILII